MPAAEGAEVSAAVMAALESAQTALNVQLEAAMEAAISSVDAALAGDGDVATLMQALGVEEAKALMNETAEVVVAISGMGLQAAAAARAELAALRKALTAGYSEIEAAMWQRAGERGRLSEAVAGLLAAAKAACTTIRQGVAVA